MDVIDLTQKLIQYPSITPDGHAVFDFLGDYLKEKGFFCTVLDQRHTQNRYYKKGLGSPKITFIGHVDVVPPGDETQWKSPPFLGHIDKNILFGRGAVDMKGAIAAFIEAALNTPHTVAILLTSDEEGSGTDGIVTCLSWLKENHEIPDLFLVGEPTSNKTIGDTIKIGRRGSFYANLTFLGKQGHVAYPDHAKNPALPLGAYIQSLSSLVLDEGTDHFDPSHLEILAIDQQFIASNVIPDTANLRLNIRYNTNHTEETLLKTLHNMWQSLKSETKDGYEFICKGQTSSKPFVAKNWPLLNTYCQNIEKLTQYPVKLSTSGGTSDARFVHTLAPVIELGLKNDLAHHINEAVPCEDLKILVNLYNLIFEL